jgi:hypothetical protein
MKYICSSCGQEHESWPAITYNSPSNYLDLSKDEQQDIAKLDSDFCIINHPHQTDRFIRCTLTQKIIDHCETLEYGLWVSVSEKSFQDYSDNYNNEDQEENYFGWLCNHLPDYDDFTAGIPTTVLTRKGNQRPEIIPHENFEHPFVTDYYNGITKSAAEKRISNTIKQIDNRNEQTIHKKKSWWKIWLRR